MRCLQVGQHDIGPVFPPGPQQTLAPGTRVVVRQGIVPGQNRRADIDATVQFIRAGIRSLASGASGASGA